MGKKEREECIGGVSFMDNKGNPLPRPRPQIAFNQGGKFFRLYLNKGLKFFQAGVSLETFRKWPCPAVNLTVTWGNYAGQRLWVKFDTEFRLHVYNAKALAAAEKAAAEMRLRNVS